mgnify:CR=1 FL=1
MEHSGCALLKPLVMCPVSAEGLLFVRCIRLPRSDLPALVRSLRGVVSVMQRRGGRLRSVRYVPQLLVAGHRHSQLHREQRLLARDLGAGVEDEAADAQGCSPRYFS